MICSSCREQDHSHCLNFGAWEISAGSSALPEVFTARNEPTNTWCDCQHVNSYTDYREARS
jgi:hypothetical protein